MRKIIWLNHTDKKINGFSFFYKPLYEDVVCPGGIVRVISVPQFSGNTAKKLFLKKMLPLIDDSVLANDDNNGFDLGIPKISLDTNDFLLRALCGLVLSVPRRLYRSGQINIVLSGEGDLKYILPLVQDCNLNIISENDAKQIEEQLLDEFGLSTHVERGLSRRKMHGNLSVFFPGTTPPDMAGRDTVLNLSNTLCTGSFSYADMICFPPCGYEKVYEICGENIQKFLLILEYLSPNEDTISIVVKAR